MKALKNTKIYINFIKNTKYVFAKANNTIKRMGLKRSISTKEIF